MKTKRKILSTLLSLFVIFQMISNIKIYTYATGGVNTFSVDTVNGKQCYVYSDPTLLPNSFSIYWVYGGKVCTAPASKWLMTCLNKKLGTTFTDNWFTDFNSYFASQVLTASNLADEFFGGNATRVSNGNEIIGVAFNDLNGLSLENDIPSNATVTTPSNVTNVTYNILNNYLEYNPETPEYIIIDIFNKNSAIDRLGNANENSWYTQSLNNINNLVTGNNICQKLVKFSGDIWVANNNRENGGLYVVDLTDTILNTSSTVFNDLVNDFSLNEYNNEILLVDMLTYDTDIRLSTYNLDGTSKTVTYNRYAPDGSVVDSNTISDFAFYGYYNPYLCINADGKVTIYKNSIIPQQISNNTYSKNFYKSTTYNNYDNSSTNNSWESNYTQINNSVQNNQNVYNETKTTTNNNTENNNYNIDNSVNDNSVTNIINNYYYGSDPDPDPDPDPDDDDSIWKALLKAIAGFFEKIGELIATLLTGIFSIFTSILDAITSITQDFTSITSFISSFFSWLPTPITELIVLGLGLALICAFLTWFKK